MYRLSSVPSPSHPTLVEAELLELYVRQAPCSSFCLESDMPKQLVCQIAAVVAPGAVSAAPAPE